MIPIISTEDIEKPRTQSELSEFVWSTLDEFSSTDESRNIIRFNRAKNIKEFKEELLPLALFADAFYSCDKAIQFQLTKGNQSFDARILDAQEDVVEYLQITLSDMNYQTHLQMIHLSEYGKAPRFGEALVKQRDGTVAYKQCQTGEAGDIVKGELNKINAAVDRKSNMGYEENTSLIVSFSGELFCRNEDIDLLHEYVKSNLIPKLGRYNTLYLVSGQKEHDYRYETSAA
jgi:hypothetical protein